MTLSQMIGMDGDLMDEGPDGRLAPIRTPIGSEPENATMQLLHQTCRSRIDRLNVVGVRRLVGKVRRPAAIQRVDEKRDVVAAAETVCGHDDQRPGPLKSTRLADNALTSLR